MAWNHTLTKLRNILAELYVTETSSRRIVADANINPQLIAFSPRSIDNWQAILEEAHKQNKLDSLLAVVEQEYDQEPFKSAAKACRDYSEPDSRPTQPLISRRPRRSTDSFTSYENGLDKLLAQLESGSEDHREVLVQQTRLSANIARVRRYGDTPDKSSERAEILDNLNTISLDVLGTSFNELCE